MKKTNRLEGEELVDSRFLRARKRILISILFLFIIFLITIFLLTIPGIQEHPLNKSFIIIILVVSTIVFIYMWSVFIFYWRNK